MTTTGRRQQRYDHRLRDLVQRAGGVTSARNVGVPRSTARGWLRNTAKAVVSLDVTNRDTSELEQEIHVLRRRVKKLTALLRPAVALPRSSRFTLAHERLPDGRDKRRILRAVGRACVFLPVPKLLRFLRLSPSRFRPWRRLQEECTLDDQSSCPHTSPHQLTSAEIRTIKEMVTAVEYRHVPTGTLAILAAATRQGLGIPVDLVPLGTEVRLAPSSPSRPPRSAKSRPANDTPQRDVAHRHHSPPPARWDPRLRARGDRQLLSTDLGVARR